ncbi:hypothetical protein TBLA_0D05400 [Henningerozyma blattae CBS 6284]|uniref:Arrestin C-terminal-like domain-containing protein n=1 Tax=Henningerozyma blattae (strain ATCC 34711 / CBS 6284 / DSM 70876 / NBRC 10599 / NRRL Y-10934 / UCD 77-7) TaxID=1071380 RepID=I2H3T1_HENB6|nr:hypothetical protein TBLA_0D05400 [Tetrapisispora blattae CBS 6284]CCH61033.1 hypothetical protein TBLA_0D05400 [Tetrapisispora blattae CBS 6284]
MSAPTLSHIHAQRHAAQSQRRKSRSAASTITSNTNTTTPSINITPSSSSSTPSSTPRLSSNSNKSSPKVHNRNLANNAFAIDSLKSPVFPFEKQITDIPIDLNPVLHTATMSAYLRLAEPVLFLQGFCNSKNSKQNRNENSAPAILRGALILRFNKTTKLKSISLNFKGESRTDWPEGIPPKKTEFVEISTIVNHTWPFFNLNSNTLPNCASSLFIPIQSSSHNTNNCSNNNTLSNNIHNSPKINNILPQQHSLISDFLSHTFSPANSNSSSASSLNTAATDHPIVNNNTNNNCNNANVNSNSNVDINVFYPGDYIYTFEQPLPVSYPESIRADFGYVEYNLNLMVERTGAFKTNLNAKVPVTIVRTNSDTSVEESEPIAISRDWESHLHYDIVIASKDIILDAFLPINFHFQPVDKVSLHRIRIYLTENLDYYCKGKKVHRVEPTKKYLLAELNGPKLKNLPSTTNFNKAKNRGNLLLDHSSGDLINKDFEFEVFVPNHFNSHQSLHPDTSYDKIKSNHWIKISLRLSRVIDGKTKHYEISIDSPIHVLHKLCCHANTLLPSYNSHSHSHSNHHTTITDQTPSNNYNSTPPAYPLITHESNIFFPKDVLSNEIITTNTDQLDTTPPSDKSSHHHHHHHYHNNNNNNSSNSVNSNNNIKLQNGRRESILISSPRLKSNIYQPDILSRNLTSPQAIPLSPNLSPILLLSPTQSDDTLPPPEFDFSKDDTISLSSSDLSPSLSNNINTTSTTNNSTPLPKNPPSYIDSLKNINHSNNKSTVNHSTSTISLSRNHSNNLPTVTTTTAVSPITSPVISPSNNPFLKINDANFDPSNLQTSLFKSSTPNFPPLSSTASPIMNQNSNNSNGCNNLPIDFNKNRRRSIQDSLPATIKYDNFSFADLNEILSEHELENNESNDLVEDSVDPETSMNSGFTLDPKFTSSTEQLNQDSIDPKKSNNNHPTFNKVFTPLDSIDPLENITNNDDEENRCPIQANRPTHKKQESSVDITTFYDKSSNIDWHPLHQTNEFPNSSQNSNRPATKHLSSNPFVNYNINQNSNKSDLNKIPEDDDHNLNISQQLQSTIRRYSLEIANASTTLNDFKDVLHNSPGTVQKNISDNISDLSGYDDASLLLSSRGDSNSNQETSLNSARNSHEKKHVVKQTNINESIPPLL